MAQNYDVGYGKPPKQTQWKKGQSGNPAGAVAGKKKPKPLIESLADQLNELVPITRGGKSKLVPLSDALAMKLLHGLLGAPVKDQISILQKLVALGLFDAQSESLDGANDDCEFSEADRRLIEMARRDFGITFEGEAKPELSTHLPKKAQVKKGGS